MHNDDELTIVSVFGKGGTKQPLNMPTKAFLIAINSLNLR
jgi:hypothetical protein